MSLAPPRPEGPRKPDWLKIRPPGGERYTFIKQRARELDLHTVCEEAHCPNVAECWGSGTATFMLMGDVCTRGCRFCAVNTNRRGAPLDPDEPRKVAELIGQLGLDYVVITSVDRDDLPDGGAAHFAACIRHLKRVQPELLVEVLIPDFSGDRTALATIAEAAPDVIAHNLETVARLTPTVRDPRATYAQSLEVLRYLKEAFPAIHTKSSLMLGLGETEDEVRATMGDLRAVACDVLTFGQYLRPTSRHLAVERYLTPEEYDLYRELGEEAGFLYVASGPLVRSSYKAGELFLKGRIEAARTEARQEP